MPVASTKTMMGGARPPDPGSRFPAEGSTVTPNTQLIPPRDGCGSGAQTSHSVCTDNPSGGETMNLNGDDGMTSDDAGGAPTALERSTRFTIYGGNGGKGGKGGRITGAGGAGEGNQLQFYPAGGDIIVNVYCEHRDWDLGFMMKMVVSLAWLGLMAWHVFTTWFDISKAGAKP
ncbi:hypothetical protein C8R44DRAFT_880593 [Mycena epipterygia]|nr:hypothetical protein C8R44DRAFT_880593 [Mycena epipterygia]